MVTTEKGGLITIARLGGGLYEVEAAGRDWLNGSRKCGVRVLLDDDDLCQLIAALEKVRLK
jgi:hypothetical protein